MTEPETSERDAPVGGRVACDFCRRDFAWFVTRTGARKPFDLETIPREDDFALAGHALRRTYPGDPLYPHRIATPVTDVSDRHLVDVERVMLPHRCAEYREAHPRYEEPRPFRAMLADADDGP